MMTLALALGLLTQAGDPPGEHYLTRDEALALVFPDADRVVERTVELDGRIRTLVQKRYGDAVDGRQDVFLGLREGRPAGFAMIHSEVTKTLRVTFIVGVDPGGRVSEVAVMAHEEHIGTDCRKRRFLDQFRGKTNAHRIGVGGVGGILPYSGATLSCSAVARGIRKTLALVQHHFLDRPENLRRALGEEPVRQERYVMGALCAIAAWGDRRAVEDAFREIRRLDGILSDYDPESELSRLNREGSLEAGPDLLSFVEASAEFSRRFGGAFDITVGPLVDLWGFRDGRHRVPPDGEIRAALEKVGSSKIRISGRRVTLDEGMRLDPGAVGKGFAVDRAAAVLREAGVRRALVDFGSTVCAVGAWEAAVRDPGEPGKSLCAVALEDESLSTSGDYEKFFEADGTRYGHILDPRTGRPARGVASVSVVAPTAAESDAAATAAFVSGVLPEALPAFLVRPDGRREMNEGWRRRLKPESR